MRFLLLGVALLMTIALANGVAAPPGADASDEGPVADGPDAGPGTQAVIAAAQPGGTSFQKPIAGAKAAQPAGQPLQTKDFACQTAERFFPMEAWRTIHSTLEPGVKLSNPRQLETFEVNYIQADAEINGKSKRVVWAADVLYNGGLTGLFLVTTDFSLSRLPSVEGTRYEPEDEWLDALEDCDVLDVPEDPLEDEPTDLTLAVHCEPADDDLVDFMLENLEDRFPDVEPEDMALEGFWQAGDFVSFSVGTSRDRPVYTVFVGEDYRDERLDFMSVPNYAAEAMGYPRYAFSSDVSARFDADGRDWEASGLISDPGAESRLCVSAWWG